MANKRTTLDTNEALSVLPDGDPPADAEVSP